MKNKRKEEFKERKELALIKMIELKNQRIALKNIKSSALISILFLSVFSFKFLFIFIFFYLSTK